MRRSYLVCGSFIVILTLLLILIGINYINHKENLGDNYLFEVYSSRILCETVKLEIYNDHTYKYYDGKSVSSGTYSYDVKKIIENNDKYEKNDYGVYILKTKNKKYEIYDTNDDLISLLKEINIDLDTCISNKS